MAYSALLGYGFTKRGREGEEEEKEKERRSGGRNFETDIACEWRSARPRNKAGRKGRKDYDDDDDYYYYYD